MFFSFFCFQLYLPNKIQTNKNKAAQVARPNTSKTGFNGISLPNNPAPPKSITAMLIWKYLVLILVLSFFKKIKILLVKPDSDEDRLNLNKIFTIY